MIWDKPLGNNALSLLVSISRKSISVHTLLCLAAAKSLRRMKEIKPLSSVWCNADILQPKWNIVLPWFWPLQNPESGSWTYSHSELWVRWPSNAVLTDGASVFSSSPASHLEHPKLEGEALRTVTGMEGKLLVVSFSLISGICHLAMKHERLRPIPLKGPIALWKKEAGSLETCSQQWPDFCQSPKGLRVWSLAQASSTHLGANNPLSSLPPLLQWVGKPCPWWGTGTAEHIIPRNVS